ncbi:uncharacterized protein F4807DRAFT_464353 [Annulohypoxylon truncatum]|uniref:uncharacterized protein n=1 Tax=Annulohypoxylon truncatum TaxID=327061 RepID=UPI0020075911|nr:uncharacterized protein F4807DRAFT_464353 [Annulohypoxylon truncatum]KAI1205891.1 hypothetical protein F4807DRAFT_464353 [Annulohypoxylon truncatum]
MVSQNLIAFLGLASTALATYSPQALKNLRDLRAEHVVVEVREAQSSSSDSALASSCSSSAEAIITDAPQPPASLESFFASFAATADLTNPSVLCQITAAVPSSLTAAYSSYDQQASSWFSAHSSDIDALVSKCVGEDGAASISQALSALDVYAAGSCTGSVSKGLAARPTGVVAGAAVAAAGVLGAAAVL